MVVNLSPTHKYRVEVKLGQLVIAVADVPATSEKEAELGVLQNIIAKATRTE